MLKHQQQKQKQKLKKKKNSNLNGTKECANDIGIA